MSGFRGNALLAIRLAEAKGDITGSGAIVWKHDKDTPYTPSALLMGDYLYFLRGNNGILSCFDAKTGVPHYTAERLEGVGNIFASLFGAKDRIYVTGQQGTFYVVKQGPEFAVLAKNTLDDHFNASPVAVENQLFLRGYRYLYCIEEE
jgi:outer membrane protein assembly factor BamB